MSSINETGTSQQLAIKAFDNLQMVKILFIESLHFWETFSNVTEISFKGQVFLLQNR